MARLTSGFWVAAYLHRLELAGIPAHVVARGDATAGAVMICVATLDGQATLYQRRFDFATDRHDWQVLSRGSEAEIAASIARQRGFDGDLWVLEIEDREGRHLLDQDGLF